MAKAMKADARALVTGARHIEYVGITSLRGAIRNPKKHADASLESSIGRFGYAEPVVIDERTQRLVAGHGRLASLLRMSKTHDTPPDGVSIDADGEWMVPVVRGWASRTDAEADAYLLASNQLTIAGGWNDAELTALLRDLQTNDPASVQGLGFDDALLSKLLADTVPAPDVDPDETPEPPAKPWVQAGDMFDMGGSRILCGDCRSFEDVKRLFGSDMAAIAMTSPPYASQRAYDESSGFKPIHPDEFVEWYRDVSANVLAHLAKDGSYFINIKEHCEDGQRHLYVKDLTVAHVRSWGWSFIDEFCWRRAGFPGGYVGRFKNEWEPVFHFARAAAGDIKFRAPKSDYAYDRANQMTMGKAGSQGGGLRGQQARPGNVIECSGVEAGLGHSAAYPVALPEFFVRAFSDPGDIIFDPFMGSGTTLIAAVKNGRRGFGTEISPRYTQVILERWEQFTGRKAIKLDAP